MSRDIFLGMMSGLGEAYHKQNVENVQKETERRKSVRDAWKELSERKDLPPELSAKAMEGYMTVSSTPHDKKLPKEWDEQGLGQFFHQSRSITQQIPVKAPVPQPMAYPGQAAPPVPPPVGPRPPIETQKQVGIFTTPEETRQMDELTKAAETRGQITGKIGGTQQVMGYLDQLRQEGRPDEEIDQIAQMFGIHPPKPPTPEKPSAVAGTITGSMLKGQLTEDALGNPIDDATSYHITRDSKGKVVGAYPAESAVTRQYWPDADSKTGWSEVKSDRFNRITGVLRDVQAPSYLTGTVSQTQTMRFVQQADGSYVAVPVTSTTTRTPAGGAPGAPGTTAAPVPPPAPPGSVKAGQTVGHKSLPEGQKAKLDQSFRAFNNTADLVQSVSSKINLLGSLIDAGKIKLAVDPSTKALVFSRLTNLTPDEAQFAADFQQLSEHINTLRLPLGASGFRGPEAFEALQAMRGRLLANPAVTKRVLDRTMQALMGQMGSIAKTLNRSGVDTDMPDSVLQSYIRMAGGDGAKAIKLMEKDGWKVD